MKSLTMASLLCVTCIGSVGICRAQDASDVEIKAYGSYAGGKFDTVDLATGNLTLDIPLISYPQRGTLPPLSFSIQLNNAPYSEALIENCDETPCGGNYQISRYDTSPPGSPFPTGSGNTLASPRYQSVIGAYITSSYAGGVVTGTPYGTTGAIAYSLIDPSGTTHELRSDTSNPNIFRAPDGTGYTFIAADNTDTAHQAYYVRDADNSTNAATFWTGAMGFGSAARLGTVYSPTGIRYTDTFSPTLTIPGSDSRLCGLNANCPIPLLQSTVKDPSGNTITRGPWYWGGIGVGNADIATFYNSHPPVFTDSIGRSIPDIISLQSALSATGNTTWIVPGPDGNSLTYTINYSYPIFNNTHWSGLAYPGNTTATITQGYAISSVTLPNGTQWTFTYDPLGSGNITDVGLPTGGKIHYTYQVMSTTDASQGLLRCNSQCEAVQSRTEYDADGTTVRSSTSYNYSFTTPPPHNVTTFTTVETDGLNNDTVHNFKQIAIDSNGNATNTSQVYETETDYYQGPKASNVLLKSVATSYYQVPTSQYQFAWDYIQVAGTTPSRITNVLPAQIVTTTPAGSTTVVRQYPYLFTATQEQCNGLNGACGPLDISGTFPSSASVSSQPIFYVAPSLEATCPGINYCDLSNPYNETTTSFVFQRSSGNPNWSSYLKANMVALPQSVQVGSPTAASSTTTYGYDDPSNIPPAGTCGNTASTVFGYQTSKTITTSLSSFSPTTSTVYNCQGMPTVKKDAMGYTTSIFYDSTGLFASKIQRPTTANGVQHIDYYSYDSVTGHLNWHTDENGSAANDANHTTTYTHDSMNRVTSITYPDGGGSSFCYTDLGGSFCDQAVAPFKVFTKTKETADTTVSTMHSFDGLGRPVQSEVVSDPHGGVFVDTHYDLDGRVDYVTNPYRSTAVAGDPPSGTTYYTYDALGRKIIQTQPDNSSAHPSYQQWCYDGQLLSAIPKLTNCFANQALNGWQTRLATYVGWSYPVEWTDISDETGRHSQQVMDALGRLETVFEPDPSSGSLSLETDYGYDALGDLVNVYQKGASGSVARNTRTFSYYAPSLVNTACNPETLSPGQPCTGLRGIWYNYDNNGNLVAKIDNRNIGTNYRYDALNRLVSKTYQGYGQSGYYGNALADPTGTPISCYEYDTAATNGKGKLGVQWTQKTQAGGICPASPPSSGVLTKTVIASYDAMGRLTGEQRCELAVHCATTTYSMGYTYDLAGKLTSYPSGFGSLTFNNKYDAAGHLSLVSGSLGTLFSVPSYTPAGALSGAKLGSSLTMSRTFDSRQRVTGETDTGAAFVDAATVSINGSEQAK